MIPVVLHAPTTPDVAPAFHDGPLYVWTGPWEVDALRLGAAWYERFLLLKDSSVILQEEFWTEIERYDTAFLFARPSCYMGIYRAADLDEPLSRIKVENKEDSVWWESRLQHELNYPVVWPSVRDSTAKRIEDVDGKPELVIGNEFIEKFKGTARCPRCSKVPERTGLCQHYLRRFGR